MNSQNNFIQRLKDDTYKAIKLLDNKFKLPKKGFISGGSISNTIWKVGGGEKAIINDIDIFIFKYSNETLNEFYDRKRKNPSIDSSLNIEDYSNILYFENDYYISFLKEERKDIFNIITIESNTKDYSMILKSFDINSCQIGYDLETKEVLFTDNYLDFFINKQLKVVNIQSPPNTLCRILKKNLELGGNSLNIKEELKLLKYSYSSIRNKNRIILSKKLENIYQDNIEIINKYFKCIKYEEYLSLFPIEWVEDSKNFIVHYDPHKWYISRNDKFTLFLESKNRYIKKGDFIYFYRNIINNAARLKLWVELPYFQKKDGYFNGYNLEDKMTLDLLIKKSRDIYFLINKSNDTDNSYNIPNTNFLENMNLKEQVFVSDYIKLKVKEDLKNLILLNFIQEPLKCDNIEDLDLLFTTLRIKYRKLIQERINLKKDNLILDDFIF